MTKKIILWVNTCVFALAATFTSSACSRQENEDANAEETISGNPASEGLAIGDGHREWTFDTDTDPVTDDAKSFASATLSDGKFRIETEVGCINGLHTQYRFRFFDENGAAEVRTIDNQYSKIAVRIDEEPSFQAGFKDFRFSNEITLRGDSPDSFEWRMFPINGAVFGESVQFRFQLTSGDVTLNIDQSDPAIIRALDDCRTGIREKLAAREPQRSADEASEQTAAAQLQGNDGNAASEQDAEQYAHPEPAE